MIVSFVKKYSRQLVFSVLLHMLGLFLAFDAGLFRAPKSYRVNIRIIDTNTASIVSTLASKNQSEAGIEQNVKKIKVPKKEVPNKQSVSQGVLQNKNSESLKPLPKASEISGDSEISETSKTAETSKTVETSKTAETSGDSGTSDDSEILETSETSEAHTLKNANTISAQPSVLKGYNRAKLIETSIISPAYTEEAIENNYEDTINVKVLVSMEGDVQKVVFENQVKFGMERALIKAAKQAKFVPMKLNNGVAVPSWYSLKFQLKIE